MDNFALYLDDLGHVLFAGIHRFMVISSADDDSWEVHVGFIDASVARWYKGSFGEPELLQIAGSKSSSAYLKGYASKLAEAFKRGNIDILDWSAENGANVRLVVAPGSPHAVILSLKELTVSEAGLYGFKVAERAIQDAKPRDGHMFPGDSIPPPRLPVPAEPVRPAKQPNNATASSSNSKKPAVPQSSNEAALAAQVAELKAAAAAEKAEGDAKWKAREKEQAKERAKIKLKRERSDSSSPEKPKPPVRPAGMSLANPTKRARKFVKQTFGSDSD